MKTHGYEGTSIYKSWESMWQRCRNPNHKSYPDYCSYEIQDDWKSFVCFLRDMGEKPEGLSLDRRDNKQGYSKENCRWATPTEQQHNRRPIQRNNTSGLKGVRYIERAKGRYKYWEAFWNEGRRHKSLGSVTDFFEACCRRKSWEATHGKVC